MQHTAAAHSIDAAKSHFLNSKLEENHRHIHRREIKKRERHTHQLGLYVLVPCSGHPSLARSNLSLSPSTSLPPSLYLTPTNTRSGTN